MLPGHFIRGYPYPVTIHVPDYFVTESSLDVVLYIHGLSDHTKPVWNDFVDSLFGDDMGVSLSMSGENVVLVMPGGTGGNAAFNTYITSRAARFDAFMGQLAQHLLHAGLGKRATFDRLVLAGHSGAHRPLRQILTAECQGTACYKEQIREVYLLDATYGMKEAHHAPFAEFASKPGNRLHTVFRRGTVVAESSRGLYNHLYATEQSDNVAFCEEFETDLTSALPCQFTCVSDYVLRANTNWTRGPSLHYRVVPIFLWRLLSADCH